jgi:hypothetical protein
MKIFASGSCRLLNAIKNTDKIEVLHNLTEPHFSGTNFMGKFHDTKSHIQFINFIKGDIKLEDDVLERFFTCYNIKRFKNSKVFEPLDIIPTKIINIRNNLHECDVYIFEICSLKLYNYKGFYAQHEQKPNNDLSEYNVTIQCKDVLLTDLHTIKNFFPNKKIIFQCHFRPNVIYNNNNFIEKREIIYNTLCEFCNENDNCFLYDPSIILKNDNNLFDGDTHFSEKGLNESFKYLCDNFIYV